MVDWLGRQHLVGGRRGTSKACDRKKVEITVALSVIPLNWDNEYNRIVLNKLVEEFILVSTSSIHNDKSWRWQL